MAEITLRDPEIITFYLHGTEWFIIKFYVDGDWYEFRMKPEDWLTFASEFVKHMGSGRIINFTADLKGKRKKK